MRTDGIKVSVVMPVYNAQEYIARTIESVLCQTLPDFELICVDDGSKDNSCDIIREYCQKDNRIVLLTQENAGAGVARNYAMSLAKGEYITFLDSDDMLEFFALEKMYLTAQKYNAEVVISNVSQFEDDDTEKRKDLYWVKSDFLPVPDVFSPDEIIPFLFDITVAGPPGKMMKTDFIRENNLEYLTLKKSEDFCFIYRALYKAERITALNESVYRKRNNVTSLENTKANNPLVFYDAIKELKKIMQEDGVYDIYKQTAINSNVTRFAYNLKSIEYDGESFGQVLEILIKIHYSELGIGFYPATYYYDENKYFYLVENILSYWKNNEVEYNTDIFNKLIFQLEKYKSEQLELAFMKEQVIVARQLDRKLKNLEKVHSDMQNSMSFRIGRLLTYIPRKIRDIIK